MRGFVLVHPAIELIVEAETRPVFSHDAAGVRSTLDRAASTRFDELPARWRARHHLRSSYVHMQCSELEAAGHDLELAEPICEELGRYFRLRHLLATARLSARRDPRSDGCARSLDALATLERDIEPLEAGRRAHLLLMRDLARAERALLLSEPGQVVRLLSHHLTIEGAFIFADDLWQTNLLLGQAHLLRLFPKLALPHLQAAADMCRIHDAERDYAEAIAAVANAETLLGSSDEGTAHLEEAVAIAERLGLPRDELRHRMMLVTARIGAGDDAGACKHAEAAATIAAKRDDSFTYLLMVGFIVVLRARLGEHKQAYRDLLHIGGDLTRRFGAHAAAPIHEMIGHLERDLGKEKFEELAAELLAELEGGQPQ